MKKYGWKILVATLVLLMMLGSSAQEVLETISTPEGITLSATMREPSGEIGTVDFTFTLEEMPVASAVLPNYSTLPPQPSAVPEPSTLLLVGLGVLGLALVRRAVIARG